ncbi:MAG: glycosyltransferase [Candidatus Aenigmarchaeota archaeon]|nr:glycosyltransferase [Candidatus Aenigmarchaeota archaeon]
MDISLIIPAYNEEDRILKTLREYDTCLKKSKLSYEILVITDGVKDNTAKIVRNFSLDRKTIILHEFPNRLGKGGAIIMGFGLSKGKFMGFVDADASVSPEDFLKMIHLLDKYDCVIASRRTKNSVVLSRPCFKRRIASSLFNVFVNLIFFLGIHDTQCGAKVMKKEVLSGINLMTPGFSFDVELLWKIKKRGYSIKEFGVIWKFGEGSSFSLKFAPEMFISLMKARLNRME